MTSKTPRISTVTSRRQFAARAAPYWTELQRGLRLGYIKPSGGPGVWVLREFRRGRYIRRRLGIADDLAPANGATVLSYADAQKAALGTDRPTLARPGRLTVAQAADDYFATRQGRPADEDNLRRYMHEEWANEFGSTVMPKIDKKAAPDVAPDAVNGDVSGDDDDVETFDIWQSQVAAWMAR